MVHTDLLQPILVLLLFAIVSIALMQKLRLSPILGYFLAGILVGPYSLGWVEHTETIQTLAEVGVAFLLFDIGLHLSFRSLWENRRNLFALAPIQILGTTLLAGGLTYWFSQDIRTAVIVGAGLSLSSTAVAMQSLKEAREENTPVGRAALSILIAQDIFVVFLLILLPTLARGGDTWIQPMFLSVLKAVAALGLVALVGRFLLRPVFEWITATKNDDVFTESALLFVLATAWGISQLGLSLPLGAFLAGLALSESDFCYLVKAEIHPFRGLLMGLFFITVGMSLNWPLALESGLPLLGMIAGLIVIKTVALWIGARTMRFCNGGAVYLSLLLAQGSEFAFVLFALAATSGLLPEKTSQLLQIAVGVSLALTPFLAWAGRLLGNRIENRRVQTPEPEDLPPAAPETEGRVFITGFDAIGQELAKILEAEGIEYIAYDSSRERVAEARSLGFRADFSDINRPKTASAAIVGKARAVVILIEDPDVSLYLAEALKQMNLSIPVYAATRDVMHYNKLANIGLTDTFHKNAQTVSLIAADLLKQLGLSEAQISDRLERVQRDQEPLLAEAFPG
jgi:monovalent cation:proton antiporter-2 (CPA2) family protein